MTKLENQIASDLLRIKAVTLRTRSTVYLGKWSKKPDLYRQSTHNRLPRRS